MPHVWPEAPLNLAYSGAGHTSCTNYLGSLRQAPSKDEYQWTSMDKDADGPVWCQCDPPFEAIEQQILPDSRWYAMKHGGHRGVHAFFEATEQQPRMNKVGLEGLYRFACTATHSPLAPSQLHALPHIGFVAPRRSRHTQSDPLNRIPYLSMDHWSPADEWGCCKCPPFKQLEHQHLSLTLCLPWRRASSRRSAA